MPSDLAVCFVAALPGGAAGFSLAPYLASGQEQAAIAAAYLGGESSPLVSSSEDGQVSEDAGLPTGTGSPGQAGLFAPGQPPRPATLGRAGRTGACSHLRAESGFCGLVLRAGDFLSLESARITGDWHLSASEAVQGGLTRREATRPPSAPSALTVSDPGLTRLTGPGSVPTRLVPG